MEEKEEEDGCIHLSLTGAQTTQTGMCTSLPHTLFLCHHADFFVSLESTREGMGHLSAGADSNNIQRIHKKMRLRKGKAKRRNPKANFSLRNFPNCPSVNFSCGDYGISI